MDKSFDVLIIGSGISGLGAAIRLAESNVKVAVLCKSQELSDCNTFWAQGGIIHVLPEDSSFVHDVQLASGETSCDAIVQLLKNSSGKILSDILLDKCRTDFERSAQGQLLLTKEAAHSEKRILYKGDYTGKAIHDSMREYLTDKQRFPHISFLYGRTAIDLITSGHHGVSFKQKYEGGRVVGAYCLNQETSMVEKIMAKKVILATGGLSGIYLHHTNAPGMRGDGIMMAKRAQAEVLNMSYVQFHPTAFYSSLGERRFLISEAVRGEGGILLNGKGERFMEKAHPLKELAPRDIVATCIFNEIIGSKLDCVFLDISFKKRDWLEKRFPTIFRYCLDHGVDPSQDPIPVVPAAHYTCGGVRTDSWGKTRLENLYAVGEVACTGLHGKNRLASTSLIEGLTFGVRSAEHILDHLDNALYDSKKIRSWENGHQSVDLALIAQDYSTLAQTMWNYVGPVKTYERLKRAKAILDELSSQVTEFYRLAELSDELIGLRNAVEAASLVVRDSLGEYNKRY